MIIGIRNFVGYQSCLSHLTAACWTCYEAANAISLIYENNLYHISLAHRVWAWCRYQEA